MKLTKRKLRKRLDSIGSSVDVQFSVTINNDEPKLFSTLDEAKSYLFAYRENNVIFKLIMNRIEIFTL